MISSQSTLADLPTSKFEQLSISVAPEQISSDLAGEAVILQLKSGIYYGLNEVGARLWELVQQPQTVADLRDTILSEYEVDAATCLQDIRMILQALMEAELILLQDGSATEAAK
ncbi:MAG: PqqD family peptide modification chaperone [Elainella sp. Prado103]|jgi:hypothetical protein|nr:PqqD family peptide modification chaperone [Elainella sp. Prado103]